MTTVSRYALGHHVGNTYTVSSSPSTTETGNLPFEILTSGDTFVLGGRTFTFVGGADSGGLEVGFFATGAGGNLHFFATTAPTQGETVTVNTHETFTICFMAGTEIATPSGATAIETLAIGDLVRTHDGREVPVLWVGRQTVSTVFADPLRVMPIRIKAGALAENLPVRDLLVSPCHAILVDDILVHAGALVNGSSIVRETNVAETFVYYHVELEDHSLMLAESVAAETFIDNVNRLAFDNWEEHTQLFPAGREIAEMAYPRAASARQVPASIVARLAVRANAIGEQLSQAA